MKSGKLVHGMPAGTQKLERRRELEPGSSCCIHKHAHTHSPLAVPVEIMDVVWGADGSHPQLDYIGEE